jgi:uncharacterized membrane protein (DUF2068 family)
MAAAARRSDPLFWVATFKLAKVAVLLAMAAGTHHLVHRDVRETCEHWARAIRLDPDDRLVHGLIERVTGASPRTLAAISLGTLLYAALYLVEGIGLLWRKRWAEYLTVTSTCLLLPIEVYELFHRPTVVRALILLANLAILVYLIWQLRRTRKGRQDVASEPRSV